MSTAAVLPDVVPTRVRPHARRETLRLLLRSRPIYAYKFDGKRYDAGDKLGFLQATVEFALKRYDLGGEFREYLKHLSL